MPDKFPGNLPSRNPDTTSVDSSNSSSEASSAAPSLPGSGSQSPKLNTSMRSLDVAGLTRRLETLNLEIGLGSPRWGPISTSSTELSSSDGSPTSSGHNSPVRESISNDHEMERLAENFEKLTLNETPFLNLNEPGKWLKSSAPRGIREPKKPLQQRLDTILANSALYEKEAGISSPQTKKSPTLAAASAQSDSNRVMPKSETRGLENHDREARGRGEGGHSV